jgi:hypothetical protein
MDEAQGDPAIRFIVTFGHRPAFSSGYHPGDAGLPRAENWAEDCGSGCGSRGTIACYVVSRAPPGDSLAAADGRPR